MSISFFDTLCLRIPSYSSRHDTIGEHDFERLTNDEVFMDALFVASPEFYQTCLKWQTGAIKDEKKIQKVKATLLKYHNRMCYRPTPFGLFSSCSTVHWGTDTNIIVATGKTRREIKLDTNFMASVVETLEEKFPDKLNYTLNSSIYKIGNEYRYYAYEITDGKRQYKINALEISDELDYVYDALKSGQLLLNQLIADLSLVFETSEEDVAGYLFELIAAQFITSTLQIRLTDDNPLKHLTGSIKLANPAIADAQLGEFTRMLHNINRNLIYQPGKLPVKNHLAQVKTIIESAGINFKPKELFQIDSYATLVSNTVNGSIRHGLAKAVYALRILSGQNEEDSWLKSIKKSIDDKFGNRPILLTQLFDPDAGINEPASGSRISFGNKILDELNSFVRAQSSSQVVAESKARPVNGFLDHKMKDAIEKGLTAITIYDDELRQFENQNKQLNLPVTFPVMFKIVNEAGATLMIDSAGGASGTTLIGRFAKDNTELHALMVDIANTEKETYLNHVIAAVVHLPQNRTGNVMQNPCVREFEIPYLAASSLPNENQISVNDIYVQMEGTQLRLYSAKLKKYIIPRIDNAHNYTLDALPIYRLLGSLQNEHITKHLAVNCSIQNNGIKFWPRVQYQQIILQCAQWKFGVDDIAAILEEKDADTAFRLFAEKCEKWNVPDLFLWAEGDQTLLVNRTDTATVKVFISEIRSMEHITIKEFIPPDPDSVKDQNGYHYNHQLVAIAHYKSEPKPSLALKPAFEKNKLQRAFFPGSEWYYYKVYCSEYFSDKLLCSVLYPLYKDWKRRAIIDKWFFIRYKDPENHVRLRFHFAGNNYKQILTKELLAALSTYIDDGLVWKAQTDTYERELERYTALAYPVIESFFDLDSTYCMEVLQDKEIYEEEGISLLWLAIKKTDAVFNLFDFPLELKFSIATKSAKLFQDEFALSSIEKDIIHRYYHSFTKQLKKSMEHVHTQAADSEILNGMFDNNQDIKVLFEANKHLFIDADANQHIARSLIHMHFNRLFPADQRRFEMIGYMIISMYYNNQLKLLNRKGVMH